MKKLLFVLVLVLGILFSTQAFGQESMYFCPDGNYYSYPCDPYYLEPGVTMGFFWYGRIRCYYPIIPGYPLLRFHPRYFNHLGPGFGSGGFHGYGRGFSSGHFGGRGFRGHR